MRVMQILAGNALAREGFATYQQHFTEATVVANYRKGFREDHALKLIASGIEKVSHGCAASRALSRRTGALRR